MKFRAAKLIALSIFVFCLPSANFARAQTSEPPANAAPGPTLTYRKVFKSSYPEFAEIKVKQDGSGTWDIRQLDETPSPQPLQIGPSLASQMFQLAAKLHDFQGVDLDVHRRVASLGQKTFRYQDGAARYQVTFNYTVNKTANQLLSLFDGLERQELDLSDMRRAMRYDQLGINDVMTRVQRDVNDKLLPEPQALLPILGQIAANSDLIDMARQRARAIAEQIRNNH
ncbi:MAG TPA: hypothetical protein VNF02_02390 [Candidatus Limnocylindrales bacterium]|nr:hypothetical protein [Candidatus Limnocylindrales bacterium]